MINIHQAYDDLLNLSKEIFWLYAFLCERRGHIVFLLLPKKNEANFEQHDGAAGGSIGCTYCLPFTPMIFTQYDRNSYHVSALAFLLC